MDVSIISIVGFVILGLCILLGIWKGMIRMLLNVVVIGLAVAAGSLGVNPIREALAEQDYFGQEWLESVLSGNLAFVIVFFAVLVVGLIVKAIIMHFVDAEVANLLARNSLCRSFDRNFFFAHSKSP